MAEGEENWSGKRESEDELRTKMRGRQKKDEGRRRLEWEERKTGWGGGGQR